MGQKRFIRAVEKLSKPEVHKKKIKKRDLM